MCVNKTCTCCNSTERHNFIVILDMAVSGLRISQHTFVQLDIRKSAPCHKLLFALTSFLTISFLVFISVLWSTPNC